MQSLRQLQTLGIFEMFLPRETTFSIFSTAGSYASHVRSPQPRPTGVPERCCSALLEASGQEAVEKTLALKNQRLLYFEHGSSWNQRSPQVWHVWDPLLTLSSSWSSSTSARCIPSADMTLLPVFQHKNWDSPHSGMECQLNIIFPTPLEIYSCTKPQKTKTALPLKDCFL